ncbi:MAG: hypothetical protein KDC97_12695 [Confluentibacter sp.]|nr:hypothetical protein [Confluentibacter sp.]
MEEFNKLSGIADIITIIAGTMTILGVSGLVTWSFFKEKKGGFPEIILSIFVYSIKTALCLVILPVMALILFFPWMIAVGFSGGDINAFPFSGREFPLGNYIGTLVISMLAVPLYVLISASIYLWSPSPFIKFYRIFSRN